MNTRKANKTAIAVTLFACIAMAGDVTNCLPLKGIGAASTMAPFPKVFCDNQGLEGFASDFTIVAERADGTEVRAALTPEMYARMKGPYNRRNVYGAAFSFGPKLPEEMWSSVFEYALGPEGELAEEFGLPADLRNVRLIIETKTRGRADEWTLQCN